MAPRASYYWQKEDSLKDSRLELSLELARSTYTFLLPHLLFYIVQERV